MTHHWKNIRSALKWRPQLWEDLRSNQYLWKSIKEDYSKVIVEERKLKALLSKGVYDKVTMEKATHIHMFISNLVFMMRMDKNALEGFKRESLRITPNEQAICEKYYETVKMIFQECHMLFLEAQLYAKELEQVEKKCVWRMSVDGNMYIKIK